MVYWRKITGTTYIVNNRIFIKFLFLLYEASLGNNHRQISTYYKNPLLATQVQKGVIINENGRRVIETRLKRGTSHFFAQTPKINDNNNNNNKQLLTKEVRYKRGGTSSVIMNNQQQQQQQQQDPSCYRSPVLQNVTLRGGIQAGYFRKLAEHVAMKLCVELCCEEKGCDVAFMWGKHCYGVQCFSRDMCEAVPAKRDVKESLMLSHVTFQGESFGKWYYM